MTVILQSASIGIPFLSLRGLFCSLSAEVCMMAPTISCHIGPFIPVGGMTSAPVVTHTAAPIFATSGIQFN